MNILAQFCQTEPGREKVLNIIPRGSESIVEFELKRIDEVRKSGEHVDFFIPFSMVDFRNLLNIHTYLSVEHLYWLKLFLVHTKTLKCRYQNTRLKSYFNRFHNYDELIEIIDSKIDDNKEIKDQASPLLYKIRMEKRSILNQIKTILKNLLEAHSYLFTELNIVERNQRYVLPVRANFKNNLQGIVHSYSNSGETVFIEPIETTALSAEIVELEKKESDEIVNILTSLTRMVRARAEDIESDLDYAAELDFLFAKVGYANRYNCTMPVFGPCFDIKNGYHPLLKHLKQDVVPLNLKMPDGKRVLLISGPNAGGKTVVLKTVGLLSLMAKCGLFIPAEEGSIIPFFDEIYADIGDEQSLESDLSTFAGHIKQIKSALESKNGNNLVLLDELMNQTSVEEGSALASAIMEEFSNRGNMVLATTHNESLKIFVSRREDMLNAGMEFTDRPTYRLILGIPQPSNAIKLAGQMGLNSGIIERARSYLDSEKASLNELFESLSKQMSAVQEQKNRLEVLIKEYETKLAELESKRKKELADLQRRYRNEIIRARRRVEELIETLKKEGTKAEVVKEVREFFVEELKEEPKEPYYPQIGEKVRIRGSGKTGEVIGFYQGRYKISFGNIFYWAKPEELEPAIAEKQGD